MKRTLIISTCFLLLNIALTRQQATAQGADDQCGTMEYLAKQKQLDPTLEARMQAQERELQKRIADKRFYKSNSNLAANSVITIPVVVHIVYNTTAQNIPDQRVYDQIAVSNRDFAGLNPHSMGAFSSALRANTGIQFCLAQKKPDGSPTTGIERRSTSVVSFLNGDSIKYYSKGGMDAWDPTIYMNIWVCNLRSITGYAQFPGTGINATYGVVVRYDAFGPTDSTLYRGNGGCTTHELGHCLNLRHIWADDTVSCFGTDYCTDTPNQAGSSSGIHSGPFTDACSPASPGIMYMNFMDYSHDIVFTNFTPDQTTRVQDCFALPSGPLLPLLSSTACSPPSECETPTALTAASITKTSATLRWTAMYGAVRYNIRYRKIGVTTWINTTSSTNSKSITGLTKSTNYEFQVQTVCTGTSPYSSSRNFATPARKPNEDALEETMAPTSITVFPNPATNQTTISYMLTEPGTASIIITNTLGAIVGKISDNQFSEPGTYSVSYNTGNLIPGIYFIRITSGEITQVRKLVIAP